MRPRISPIFSEQRNIIEKYEKIFCNLKTVQERLECFRSLNKECLLFINRYLAKDSFRIYYFSFWIGTLFFRNFDILMRMSQIITFSPSFCDFKTILTNVSREFFFNESDEYEDKIIDQMKNKMVYQFQKIIPRVIKIQRFLRHHNNVKNIKKYLKSINLLLKRFPREIVEKIFVETNKNKDNLLDVLLKYKIEIGEIMNEYLIPKEKRRYTAMIFQTFGYDKERTKNFFEYKNKN